MKRAAHRILPRGFAVLCAFTAAGCSALWAPNPMPKVRPVSTVADQARSDESSYQDAVYAIAQRDYALGLDYLQSASMRNPNDARVFNAFGVVYDKLGRFDLSARYYAKARELDPHSQIVLKNITYSTVLRARSSEHAAAPIAADNTIPVENPAAISGRVGQDAPRRTAAISKSHRHRLAAVQANSVVERTSP